MGAGTRYDVIGRGYARGRREDPRIAAQIHAALGDARTVVNVGAGTGSYEPPDRRVVAVEPSTMMLSQRPPGAAPVVRGVAEALPFGDGVFDAAMAVLTVHHWRNAPAGLAELARVARRQLIVMNEGPVGHRFWLADYFPDLLMVPTETAPPTVADIEGHLQVRAVEPVPVPADCRDGFLCAYWNRPEAYLDPTVRAGMSPLAQLPLAKAERGCARLSDNLASGVWDARHRQLRALPRYDWGYRLIIAGSAAPTGQRCLG
jgi:SAM-dependent methyltransferase